MKTIRLPGISFPVSQFCLGCAYLGSREDEKTSFEILDTYYDAGGRFLNTAHEYGYGKSETTIGKWIRERGIRDEVIVTSKIGEDHTKPKSCAMHAEELFEDIDETLSRTGFDYLDFCMLHLDDPSVPVAEIMGAMNEIRLQGKIRYYGCSNWSIERQREAAAWADAHGCPHFALDEIEMSLSRLNYTNAERGIKWMDGDYIAYHRETGMPVAAYSPICNGLLTKYLRDGDVRAWSEWQIKSHLNDANLETARRLGKVAAETGCTPTQVQIAWQLAQPYGFVSFPIVGARTVAQLQDSLSGIDCTLTPEMIEYLTPKEESLR